MRLGKGYFQFFYTGRSLGTKLGKGYFQFFYTGRSLGTRLPFPSMYCKRLLHNGLVPRFLQFAVCTVSNIKAGGDLGRDCL